MRNGNNLVKAKFFLGELVPEKVRDLFNQREKEMLSSSEVEKEAMKTALLHALSNDPAFVMGEGWEETVASFMGEAREHVSFMENVHEEVRKRDAERASRKEQEAEEFLSACPVLSELEVLADWKVREKKNPARDVPRTDSAFKAVEKVLSLMDEAELNMAVKKVLLLRGEL